MKSKKGFTLVELLAVIAILAILVIIALPNILNLYRNARENVFVSDVQNILRVSQQAYVTNSLTNKNKTCFDSKSNPLDIESKSSLKYKVELSSDGKIISIQVIDNNYQLIKTNGTDIKRDDIGNSRSNKEIKSETRNENQGLTACDGTSIEDGEIIEESKPNIQYTSMLKAMSFNVYDTDQGLKEITQEQQDEYDNFLIYFLFSPLESEKIESIKFETTNKVPTGVVGSADVSNDNSKNIMMWWTDTDGNNLYEVTIGGEGGVRANTDSAYLFSLSNLTSIDLTNLDTSQVKSMYSMFSAYENLTTLDLSPLDTSNVTNMVDMFSYSPNLQTITFGDTFDTSQVTNMYQMFDECTNLTTLDLSNFNTSKVINMSYMFGNCPNLESIKFGDNFNTSQVTNMSFMFYMCENLTTLNLSNFIIDVNADLSYMFEGTDLLTNEPYIKYNSEYADRF